MKKIFYLAAALVIGTAAANAQTAAKSIYFEVGGPSLASFNFDSRFGKGETGLGGRIGLGGYSIDGEGAVFTPVGLNYLLGGNDKFFELGVGVTPVIGASGDQPEGEPFSATFGHVLFGYRKQPAKGGFSFRAFVSPAFGRGFFIPYYGGLSFGYSFGVKK